MQKQPQMVPQRTGQAARRLLSLFEIPSRHPHSGIFICACDCITQTWFQLHVHHHQGSLRCQRTSMRVSFQESRSEAQGPQEWELFEEVPLSMQPSPIIRILNVPGKACLLFNPAAPFSCTSVFCLTQERAPLV